MVQRRSNTDLIASPLHTVVLVVIFLGLAVLGPLRSMISGHHANASSVNLVQTYALLLLFESALLYAVWKGISARGVTLRQLVGGHWASMRDVGIDALFGFGLWAIWSAISALVDLLTGSGNQAVAQALMPTNFVEIGLFVLVSISAGISEEILFRGYLQQQILAMTKMPWFAIVVQALLFSAGHAYQGVYASIKIAVYGLLFGVFAYWRRSIRPGIIAHAWTDIFSGLIASHLLH